MMKGYGVKMEIWLSYSDFCMRRMHDAARAKIRLILQQSSLSSFK